MFPNAVFANSKGEVFDYPELKMLGRFGDEVRMPEAEELIRTVNALIGRGREGRAPIRVADAPERG